MDAHDTQYFNSEKFHASVRKRVPVDEPEFGDPDGRDGGSQEPEQDSMPHPLLRSGAFIEHEAEEDDVESPDDEDDEAETPTSQDLADFFGPLEPYQQIAICRTYANYLSAMLRGHGKASGQRRQPMTYKKRARSQGRSGI